MLAAGVKGRGSFLRNFRKNLSFGIPPRTVKVADGASLDQAKSSLSDGAGGELFVSVISTCLNEEAGIERWLSSLLAQTFRPHEVVIADGGSTDNTKKLIRSWQSEHQELPLVLLERPGANIARGRNEAVRESKGSVLAFSDVGSEPSSEWLQNLVAPFVRIKGDLNQNPTQVVLGVSQTSAKGTLARAIAALILQKPDEISPDYYLASGRSIAVSRGAFNCISGFDEALTLAGEDTLFNIRLREEVEGEFFFAPLAVALWQQPEGFSKNWTMIFRYARGDAEAGLFYGEYLNRISELLTVLVGVALGLLSLYLSVSRGIWGQLIIAPFAFYFAGTAISPFIDRLRQFPWLIRISAPLLLISAQVAGFLRGLWGPQRTYL